jgi:hypothetical protein
VALVRLFREYLESAKQYERTMALFVRDLRIVFLSRHQSEYQSAYDRSGLWLVSVCFQNARGSEMKLTFASGENRPSEMSRQVHRSLHIDFCYLWSPAGNRGLRVSWRSLASAQVDNLFFSHSRSIVFSPGIEASMFAHAYCIAPSIRLRWMYVLCEHELVVGCSV